MDMIRVPPPREYMGKNIAKGFTKKVSILLKAKESDNAR